MIEFAECGCGDYFLIYFKSTCSFFYFYCLGYGFKIAEDQDNSIRQQVAKNQNTLIAMSLTIVGKEYTIVT